MAHVIPQDQPVVILGGFLITDEAYQPLAEWIHALTGAPVRVVHATRLDWLLTNTGFGWTRLLQRVDSCVRDLQTTSSTERVTLIGHSSGGVMLRAYLSTEEFLGHHYNGAERCNRLITLGSPHQARRGTSLRLLVDRRFPGCTESSRVDYISVAGILDLTSEHASAFSRRTAATFYRQIGADPAAQGDGLVPLSAALLRDSRSVVLDDTAHGGFFGQPWYGSPERIGRWWSALEEG